MEKNLIEEIREFRRKGYTYAALSRKFDIDVLDVIDSLKIFPTKKYRRKYIQKYMKDRYNQDTKFRNKLTDMERKCHDNI